MQYKYLKILALRFLLQDSNNEKKFDSNKYYKDKIL